MLYYIRSYVQMEPFTREVWLGVTVCVLLLAGADVVVRGKRLSSTT